MVDGCYSIKQAAKNSPLSEEYIRAYIKLNADKLYENGSVVDYTGKANRIMPGVKPKLIDEMFNHYKTLKARKEVSGFLKKAKNLNQYAGFLKFVKAFPPKAFYRLFQFF